MLKIQINIINLYLFIMLMMSKIPRLKAKYLKQK
jgi:hypothetical protein